MRRGAAIAAMLLALAPRAWAKGDHKGSDDDEEESADDSSDEDSGDDSDDSGDDEGSDESDDSDDKPAKTEKAAKKPAKKPEDTNGLQKQDLTGHDLGTNKKASEFEKDRFFVDKVDTEKTEKGTLVQGSLSTSAFYYTESGGVYPGLMGTGNQGPSRMFGDLRLQTDFRHISGGRWDARVDARLRYVNTPANHTLLDGQTTEQNHIQSGLTGENEYDIRELWLIRSGKRSDVFLGRQFIPDLGGIKIDGLRVDYAQSKKFTLIGFGGLYPLRGSRSLSTDYDGTKTVAGGFGAAYRTGGSYGSFGGVTEVPLAGEKPRIYGTSSGYWRNGPTLDLYHFALIDLYGSAGFQLTNLSAGANYKPNPRLRLTASVNRVDTETLAVQAQAFLNPIDNTTGGTSVIQNEAFIRRLSTNQARAGVSAGLGHLQRFEVSTALTFRYRPAFNLVAPNGTKLASLDAAQSVDLWGGIVDRHSIKDARVGIDVTQSFGVGAVPYQRSDLFGLRFYVGHDIKDGRGDLELEVAYTAVKDKLAMGGCATPTDLASCFGASKSTLFSVGGETNYRINANWLAIGSLFVTKIGTQVANGMMVTTDPSVTSITGFGRVSYRF